MFRSYFKTGSKEKEKSEQLSETVLETHSHLPKLCSCKKAKDLKERRKADLICIWKKTLKTHHIFGKFDMPSITWVLWGIDTKGLKRKATRLQYFFQLYPKYRSKSTWVALQNWCQLRNSTDNYLRNKHWTMNTKIKNTGILFTLDFQKRILNHIWNKTTKFEYNLYLHTTEPIS